MNIHAKLLNGEFLTFEIPENSTVPFLTSQLYTQLPEAPLGSLVLRHDLPELEEDADEVTQLMVMGEALTFDVCDHTIVTHLFDEMVVLVLIDSSLIQPTITKDHTFFVQERRWISELDQYTISFHHIITHELITSVTVVHKLETDQWALVSTFHALPTSADEGPLYKPTLETKWRHAPSVCLLDTLQRIPRDHTSLGKIQYLFDYEEWEDPSEEEWDDAPEFDPIPAEW